MLVCMYRIQFEFLRNASAKEWEPAAGWDRDGKSKINLIKNKLDKQAIK